MVHFLQTLRLLSCTTALLLTGCSSAYKPQAGDLLFQSLPHGRLVDAIEGATGSPYSHCGIVEENLLRWTVIEAIGPVKSTTLYEWKKRGRGETIWVYRLKGKTAEERAALAEAAKAFLGRPYDIRYRMDDEKIYCSELLYKAHLKLTGQPLGKIQTLGELKWTPFEELIREIEKAPPPLDREMITPRAVSEAPELEFVGEF